MTQRSQMLAARGVRHVVLYTDAANPASNSIYCLIGFNPPEDHLDIRFER